MSNPSKPYPGQLEPYKPGKLVTSDKSHYAQTCEEKQARAVANQSIKKSLEK